MRFFDTRIFLTLISAAIAGFFGMAALFPPVFDPVADGPTPPPPGVTAVHERTVPLSDVTVELCYYIWTRGCA